MIESLAAGLFGLLIGSFLNVCIYRLPRDLSGVQPRSFCPACERTIAWYDNVPLLSFLWLRGRCRHCQARIPARYPTVELLTGVLFFSAVYSLGVTPAALKLCVFEAILVELIFSDLEERILPDEFTLGGTALGFAFAAIVPLNGAIARVLLFSVRNPRLLSVAEAVLAVAVSAGALWLIGALYQKIRGREGLGFGDVKMVAMIAAFLGLEGVLLTLIVGSLLGAFVGLLYIFLAGKDAATYELPFGSFLGAAALGVAFYGAVVVSWWSGLGM